MRSQGKLLEPVDVTAAYKNDGQARDAAVEVSDVVLHISPDALTVLSEVSGTLLAPAAAARPAQPLYGVSAYTRVCVSQHHRSIAPPYTAVGAGGLDPLGDERGFTFWAPVAPPGHAALGHVLTPGTSQPTHEVVCVALSSGIAAWPLGFTQRWHGGGTVVWDAIAPPGYAALGCLATPGSEAPPTHSMACIHMSALVLCPLGECLARSGEGCLWAVDNGGGCFTFSGIVGALSVSLTASLSLPQ
jgi:vacuolar protein sorting-associated protein 13A/C